MSEAQTTLRKQAYPNQEEAHRAAHLKTVRNMKGAIKSAQEALAERVKAGEKEIAFFESELKKAEKVLATFEAGVTAAAAKKKG